MSVAVVAGIGVDTRHWIGGRRIAGGSATFDDLSPIDGRIVARISRGGQAEAEAAVAAALGQLLLLDRLAAAR